MKQSKLPAEGMTAVELMEAQDRVAVKDPQHLAQWLQATGREFLVFVTRDLIAAMQPYDQLLLQQFINSYLAHRLTIAFDTREEIEPVTGEKIRVDVCKDDRLTSAEKDRLVRKLVGELRDEVVGWDLTGEPM
jgi:hypothetical protein